MYLRLAFSVAVRTDEVFLVDILSVSALPRSPSDASRTWCAWQDLVVVAHDLVW
ncbi:hypothetical protein QJS66_22880 [Kocuria rhizophila]|nr:hypothetical protein QJS66_22880 [Kocuria rhizophila]